MAGDTTHTTPHPQTLPKTRCGQAEAASGAPAAKAGGAPSKASTASKARSPTNRKEGLVSVAVSSPRGGGPKKGGIQS